MNKGFLKTFKKIPGSTIAGIVLIIAFAIITPGYLSGINILNILKSAAPLLIVSVGMTMTILLGEIDMSVGGVLTVSATFAGMYLQSLESVAIANVIIAVLISCGVGTAFGIFNGFMIGTMRFNFWLVTFGSMSVAFGLTAGITNGNVLSGYDKLVRWISDGKFLGTRITMCIIWAVIICVIAIILVYKTRFGLHLFAIGDAEACAINSGINVRKTRFIAYAISGLMSGIAGIILLTRTNSTSATLGEGYEFNAIAAVVVGGTAMEGGKGGYKGTIFGAIFISAMKNGLQLVGLSNYWQQVLLGVVIVAIIIYDVLNAKRISKKNLRRVYSENA